MKIIISTIMCVSFVSGMYEVIVDGYLQHNVYYTGGGYAGTAWHKEMSWTERRSEESIRSLISEEQWNELVKNDIIECEIRVS